MSTHPIPQRPHFGIYVRDMAAMTRFCKQAFGLHQTDHGTGRNFGVPRVRMNALGAGATKMRGMNHGKAQSIDFLGPDDNTIEVYPDTPWYIPQPHDDPLDLAKSDAEWAAASAASAVNP